MLSASSQAIILLAFAVLSTILATVGIIITVFQYRETRRQRLDRREADRVFTALLERVVISPRSSTTFDSSALSTPQAPTQAYINASSSLPRLTNPPSASNGAWRSLSPPVQAKLPKQTVPYKDFA